MNRFVKLIEKDILDDIVNDILCGVLDMVIATDGIPFCHSSVEKATGLRSVMWYATFLFLTRLRDLLDLALRLRLPRCLNTLDSSRLL